MTTTHPVIQTTPVRAMSSASDQSGGVRASWSGVLFASSVGLVIWAPLAFGSVEPWAVAVIELVVLALVLVWVIGGTIAGTYVVPSSPMQLALYGLAGLAAVQAIVSVGSLASVDPFASMRAVPVVLTMAAFFSVVLVGLDSPSRLASALQAVFIAGFGLAVLALVQYLAHAQAIYGFRAARGDFFGPFVNKNHFAGLMEIWAPAGIGLVAAGAVPKERWPLFVFGTLIMGVAAVFSRSRGGMIALAAEAVFFVALWASSRRDLSRSRTLLLTLGGLALLLGGIVLGVVWLGSDSIVDRLSTVPGEISSVESYSRLALWRDTLAIIRAHPIFGAGIGAYATAYTLYSSAPGTAIVYYAHNDYLQAIAEGGVVGGLLGILLVVGLGTATFRSIRSGNAFVRGAALAAATGCFGLLVHSFVDFNLQIPSNALAFLFAAAIVVRAADLSGASNLSTRKAAHA